MKNHRQRVFLMTVLMAVSCLTAAAAVLLFIYKVHKSHVLSDLQATVQSQARLIEAVARHDSRYGGKFPGGPREATLSQIRDSHEKYRGFGETGEFALAHQEGNRIVFEFRHGREGVKVPESLPFDSDLAEPMQRALSGRSGAMIGKDYEGKTVLAAYEPVDVLDLGIVAKMDMAEFRAPFLNAALLGLGVTLLVVLAGVVAFRKISDPMLEKLESHAALLEQEVAERKQAQERAHHLNQVLRAIRNVNQLITVEKDREKLIQQACESLVETRGFDSAWIALLDGSGRPETVVQEGLGEDFQPFYNMLKEGRLPACGRKALEQADAVITRDPASECPECPLVLRNKYQRGAAGMTMPLEHEGTVYGLMCVSLPLGFADDPEEQGLFREVGGDIAYALYSLELEENRRRAEEDLKASRERLSLIVNTVPAGITIVDRDGKISFANPAAQSILGLTLDEALNSYYNEPGFNISSVDGSPFPDEELPFNRVRKEGQPVFGVEHA
ncbi:MAG: GAF domain-containing protein, partial [bacterium]